MEFASSIQLKRKKIFILTIPLRLIGCIIAFCGMLISLPLFLSVIAVPIGFFVYVGSERLFALSRGQQKVTCPYCYYESNYVTNNTAEFTCRKCKMLTPIDWM